MLKHASSMAMMGCALLASSAMAFNPDEIDKVDITVDYSVDAIGMGAAQDFTFRMDDQDVEVNFELQPGTFKIKIQGWLIGLEDTEAGKAFYGESGDTTITGMETTPTTISIIVLDQETYSGTNDQSVELAPIIVSVSVSPSVIRAGDAPAVLTFAAVDPNIGEDPGAWVLSMGTDFTGFAHHSGNAGGNAKECAAGLTCGISYTAQLNDYGNIPFTMEVSDADGNGAGSDTVSGYVAIDSSGAVVIDASVYHIPEILDGDVTQDGNFVNYGAEESVTISVAVKDWDLSTGLETDEDVTVVLESVVESLASPITETAEGVACTAGEAGCTDGIACLAADVTINSTASVGQVKGFTLEWKPWVNNQLGAAAYGETWCEFTFHALDSQGLKSQTTTVVLAAIGTSSTGGSFTQIPLFEVIAVETYTPTVQDAVEFVVYMRDPDSDFTLTVDQSAVSDTATQSFALELVNCGTQCSQSFTVPMDKTGLIAGDYVVQLKLTDSSNPNLQDVRDLTFSVAASGARRGRRSAVRRSEGATGLSFSISDGTMTVAKAGDWSSNPKSNDDVASGSAGLGAGVVAGLATGGAVALIAVGVAIRRRRAAASKSVDIDLTYDDEMAKDSSGVVLSAVV